MSHRLQVPRPVTAVLLLVPPVGPTRTVRQLFAHLVVQRVEPLVVPPRGENPSSPGGRLLGPPHPRGPCCHLRSVQALQPDAGERDEREEAEECSHDGPADPGTEWNMLEADPNDQLLMRHRVGVEAESGNDEPERADERNEGAAKRKRRRQPQLSDRATGFGSGVGHEMLPIPIKTHDVCFPTLR